MAVKPQAVPLWKRLARLSNCKEASRLLSQQQDHRLAAGDWVRLRIHIHWCLTCQRVERQMRLLREAMRRYRQ
jgi:D-serine deaminase-like pyridoxal phosphate-dependent protein